MWLLVTFFPFSVYSCFTLHFSPLLCGEDGLLSFLFPSLYQLPWLSFIWKLIVGNSNFVPLFLLCLKELAMFLKKL